MTPKPRAGGPSGTTMLFTSTGGLRGAEAEPAAWSLILRMLPDGKFDLNRNQYEQF